jgi:hypothetical protein
VLIILLTRIEMCQFSFHCGIDVPYFLKEKEGEKELRNK